MTPKIATTTFTTGLVNLPEGLTPADGFRADMYLDGVIVGSVEVPDADHHATFTLTEPGTYYSTVSKLATDGTEIGSAASAEFELDDDTTPVQVEVPVTVNVGVVDAVAAPKSVQVAVGVAKRAGRK